MHYKKNVRQLRASLLGDGRVVSVQDVHHELAERRPFERSVVCTQLVQDTAGRPHVARSAVTDHTTHAA